MRKARSHQSSVRRPRITPFAWRPQIELLEGRLAPATYTVINNSDCNTDGCGSLREAIEDSNANAGIDLINFNIGSGVQTIAPTSSLPMITDSVIIDGTTQPGSETHPRIVLSGVDSAPSTGLTITSGGNLIKGLVINSYSETGLDVRGPGGNTIVGNFIGTDASGANFAPNVQAGIRIRDGSNNNRIGGTSLEERNVISSHSRGVWIEFADGTIIQGNHIGTDVAGTKDLGLGLGIEASGATGTLIGGTASGARNVISGNTTGIGLGSFTGGGNVIQGNYIGTDVTGTKPLPNAVGITLASKYAFGTIIGGLAENAGNLISGNVQSGIAVDSKNNWVAGNLIGTDRTGSTPIANGSGIVLLTLGLYTTIGGPEPEARNIISGNTTGVHMWGGSSNSVQGNYIGTDSTGTTAVPNGTGVKMTSGSWLTVGGMLSGSGNLISGNTSYGIDLVGGGNVDVQGNLVGTDFAGSQQLPNGIGVHVVSQDVEIGGTDAASRNLISGNLLDGIVVEYGSSVVGNYIGTDITGTSALPNGRHGVHMLSASGAEIGGSFAAARNVISGNGNSGIFMSGGSSNLIIGNYIGTGASGETALGNGTYGVHVAGGVMNTIGSTQGQAGNVISGNAIAGLRIDNNARTTQIIGNYLGTDASGTAAVPNGIGVSLRFSAVTIGGTAAGAGNIIAHNSGSGVLVDVGDGNVIRQNSIHSNGALGIDLVNGGNNEQRVPSLNSAVAAGGTTTIAVSLALSAPLTVFAIDFFSSPVCDPSTFGEGEIYLGSKNLTTKETGRGRTIFVLGFEVPVGQVITATATSPNGDTSEFSKCRTVTGSTVPDSGGDAAMPLLAPAKSSFGGEVHTCATVARRSDCAPWCLSIEPDSASKAGKQTPFHSMIVSRRLIKKASESKVATLVAYLNCHF